jgi:hypothetical protein
MSATIDGPLSACQLGNGFDRAALQAPASPRCHPPGPHALGQMMERRLAGSRRARCPRRPRHSITITMHHRRPHRMTRAPEPDDPAVSAGDVRREVWGQALSVRSSWLLPSDSGGELPWAPSTVSPRMPSKALDPLQDSWARVGVADPRRGRSHSLWGHQEIWRRRTRPRSKGREPVDFLGDGSSSRQSWRDRLRMGRHGRPRSRRDVAGRMLRLPLGTAASYLGPHPRPRTSLFHRA